MKHTDFENAKRLKMEREYFETHSRNAGQFAVEIIQHWADRFPNIPTLPRRTAYRDKIKVAIQQAAEQAIQEIDTEFEKL